MRPLLALAAAALAACQGSGREEITLRIVSPASPTFANGPVDVAVEVGVRGLERLELLVDGEVAGSRTAPPFAFVLETAPLPEGAHALLARAWRTPPTELPGGEDDAGDAVLSAPVTLVVDRTPPWIVSTDPPSTGSLFPGRPLEVTFDEPVAVVVPPGLGLVAGGAAVSARVTGVGQRLSIAPEVDEVQPVSLAVEGTIVDRAGNRLGGQHWRGFAYPFAPVARLEPSFVVAAAATAGGEGLVAWTAAGAGAALLAHGGAGAGFTTSALADPLEEVSSCATAVTPAGEILVSTGPALRVRRWTGSGLEPMGTVIAEAGTHALQVDAAGQPVIAWPGRTEAHVAAWDAARDAFVEGLPALPAPDGRCIDAIALAGSGASPMLRLHTSPCGGGAYDARLHRWSGSAWVEAPLPGGLPVLLAPGPGGAPLAVSGADVHGRTPPFRLFVWDGAAWQEPWPPAPIWEPHAAAVDADGHPLVLHRVWGIGEGTGLGLVRHDGSAWVHVVPAGTLANPWVDRAALAAGPGSTALVAWIEGVQSLDFARWVSW